MFRSLSSPPTSTVSPPLSLPSARLRPPPRPPRLRPTSRSGASPSDASGSNANANSGLWTDVPLEAFFDYPQDEILTTQKDYAEGSFIDMHKDPAEAVSPTRDLSSPAPGVGDTFSPPSHDGDRTKKRDSGQTTKSVSSVHSDSGAASSHPAKSRSATKSAFLVLSCAGAMIINVGWDYHSCFNVVLTHYLRPRMLLPCLSPFQPSERSWGSGKINCNGSSLHTPSQRCVGRLS